MSGWEAACRILTQTARNDGLKTGSGEFAELPGFFVTDGSERVRLGLAVKCVLPREHFVEHRSEGKDIGTRVHPPAFRLFGRHVGHRADQGACFGSRGRRGYPAWLFVRQQRPYLCQPEIQDLDSPVFGEKDVLGLQVPVGNALGMRRRQALGDRNRDLYGACAQSSGESSQARPQRFAMQQLSNRVSNTLLVAEVVNRQDVGMRKGGRRLSLDFKPGQGVRMRGEMLGKDLDRHRAIQPRVRGPIDFAHAAGAQPRLDPVVAERAPDHPVPPVHRKRPDRHLQRGAIQQHRSLGFITEQRLDFPSQFLIAGAGLAQKAIALGRVPVPWRNGTTARPDSIALHSLALSTTQFAAQPDLGQSPVPHHRFRGNLQYLGRFLDAQPAEEAQLNHLAFAKVKGGKCMSTHHPAPPIPRTLRQPRQPRPATAWRLCHRAWRIGGSGRSPPGCAA